MKAENALTSLRDELDARRAALQLTLTAIEMVSSFLDEAAKRGLTARVEQASHSGIRIAVDLTSGPAAASELPRRGPSDDPDPESGDKHEPAPVAEAAACAATGRAPEPGGKPALWSEAEDETAVRMYREGATVAAIAAALGRPVGGTTFRLKKLRKRLSIPPRADGRPSKPVRKKSDLPVSPSPKSMRPSSSDQQGQPAAADAGCEGQDGAAAADQGGAAQRPGHSLQAKPVSAGTVSHASGLTNAQREIESRLSTVPAGSWTTDDDLDLVEGISRGMKLLDVVADIERDTGGCLARWRWLCPRPNPQSQADLLVVLRRRLAQERGAA